MTTTKKDDKTPHMNRSVVVVPSTFVNNALEAENVDGVEKTEIAVQVSVRHDGGWGWVVLVSAFVATFIIDGTIFTFGALLKDIGKELKMPDSPVALINSVQTSMYFFMSPVASGVINKFGFRACLMTGSMIYAFSLLISYFAVSYSALIIFYGLFSGSGSSLCNMAANIVVGFYFHKLRSLVILIVSCGSSLGITVMYPVNAMLVSMGGWRATLLLHVAFIGISYFLALTFRPILSLTVTQTDDATTDPTQTVTYLPSVMGGIGGKTGRGEQTDNKSTTTERFFKAVSSPNFPTAAAVVTEGGVPTINRPGTSKISRLTLRPLTSQAGINSQQKKELHSMLSNIQNKQMVSIVEPVLKKAPIKLDCCGNCCQWNEHVSETRPMYRDDVFYTGKVEDLPEYKKSMIGIPEAERTGLEYDLAVTRTIATKDLSENRGLFTMAIRRVLSSMLDISIIRRPSYIVIILSTFFVHLGWLVPYIYIADKNKLAGIPTIHADLFVSVIGITNLFAKLLYGVLATKCETVTLLAGSLLIAGVITILSDVVSGVYYQYFYCAAFGIFSAGVALRPIVLVEIYGLDKLTNAIGMLYIFSGMAVLLSAPLAAIVKDSFGYTVSFYVAGFFLVLGGAILIPVKKLSKKELMQKKDRKSITIQLPKKLDIAPSNPKLSGPKQIAAKKSNLVQ